MVEYEHQHLVESSNESDVNEQWLSEEAIKDLIGRKTLPSPSSRRRQPRGAANFKRRLNEEARIRHFGWRHVLTDSADSPCWVHPVHGVASSKKGECQPPVGSCPSHCPQIIHLLCCPLLLSDPHVFIRRLAAVFRFHSKDPPIKNIEKLRAIAGSKRL